MPRPQPVPDAELERLAAAAVPMTSLNLTPDGRMIASGRHALGLTDVVIELEPLAVLELAYGLSVQAVALALPHAARVGVARSTRAGGKPE